MIYSAPGAAVVRWVVRQEEGKSGATAICYPVRTWFAIPGCTGLRGRENMRSTQEGDPEIWVEGVGRVEVDENLDCVISLK